jgi:radical SAM superfamily enzyme YgiQ (UPF0313 family)
VQAACPDLIGISSWGVSLPFALALAERLGTEQPGVPVVLGGLQATFPADRILLHAPSLHAAVVGEGEAVLPEIVRRVQLHHRLEGLPGVAHRRNGHIVLVPPGRPLPPSRWRRPDYSTFMSPVAGQFLLEGSRGCIHQCVFCSLNGQGFRRRRPEQVASDFCYLVDCYGAASVSVVDNLVPVHGAWTEALCGRLRDLNVGVPWCCSTRVDTVSARTALKMRRAGCMGVFVGVESASEETISRVRKTSAPAQYVSRTLSNILMLEEAGLRVRVSTIIGFPHEGVDDIHRTVDLVLQLQSMGVNAYTGAVVAYPGTALWRECANDGLGLWRIRDPRVRRNHGGFYADRYAASPYLVPNAFVPAHRFLSQDALETLLAEGLAATL